MVTIVDRVSAARADRMVPPPPKPQTAPIAVNGVEIPATEIAQEAQHHPAGDARSAWDEAARALVVRQLLLQEARCLGVVASPSTDEEGRRESDEEALLRALVAQEVITPEADEATCRRYFEANRRRFRSDDLYAVRHILVAAAPDDTKGRQTAKTCAQSILDRLMIEPGAFAALAAAHSGCPSKEVGGSLGQVSRGQTVAEFEAALADAPVGEVCAQLVETRYGYHVIAVDQKVEGADLPFEAVRTQLARWLAERTRRIAIRQYIARLASRAQIEGIDIDTSAAAQVAG